MKIEIKVKQIAPSRNINPDIIYSHFNWRKNSIYKGKNTIQIGDVLEPIWWNRPLKSNTPIKKEANGIYSYNLPYIRRTPDFKTDYNILVGKGTVPIIMLLKVNYSWTPKQRNVLRLLPTHVVYETLVSLGVDSSKLEIAKNDLLYNGKKFVGNEEAEYGGWYGAATVVTLNYTKEKHLFDQLTGEYANARGICGIQEETGNIFTKEEFIERLIETFKKKLETL